MFRPQPSSSDEVEHLLRNAQLRDELEPLFDESIDRVNPTVMTTRSENEFLESMLEWERAPILPISQWFDPELVLPHPDGLSGHQLVARAAGDDREAVREARRARLHRPLERLPALLHRSFATFCRRRKRSSNAARRYLHWDCANINDNPDIWLRYYASDAERELWAEENDQPLPHARGAALSPAIAARRRCSIDRRLQLRCSQHLRPDRIAHEQPFAREPQPLAVVRQQSQSRQTSLAAWRSSSSIVVTRSRREFAARDAFDPPQREHQAVPAPAPPAQAAHARPPATRRRARAADRSSCCGGSSRGRRRRSGPPRARRR